MNVFGQLFKVQIFGESHGPLVGVTIDGCPPGIPIALEDFEDDLKRRQGNQSIGTTPRKESDTPIIQSGVFNGCTTGAPLQIVFLNENTRSEDYTKQRAIPRPSHADFVAHQKFNGFEDYRGGGHFSARLTTGIVAAGVIAKKILTLAYPNIKLEANILSVGGRPTVEEGLTKAIAAKDSVGAIIQMNVYHPPVGLGEPFWDSLESKLAHTMFSIPAVKGIEFGAGFEAANMLGSEHNDSIIDADGTTETNHAGGIVGGISNGNTISFQLAFKPTASTPKTQKSWNTQTAQIEEFSIKGRHDLCVALRAPAIVEAMTAIVLLDLQLINNRYITY